MDVAAITWEVEDDDTVQTTRETFSSEQAFIEAGHDEYLWSSFRRGLNEEWEEDGILKIPEWLAVDKGFPYASKDRHGNTDWGGYAAVNLDTDRETEKALFINHIRCSGSSILSGTKGLRRRNEKAWVPKSQVTLYTLEHEPMTKRACWACGLPMPQMSDGVLDTATVRFTHDGVQRSERLCDECAPSFADSDEATVNLQPCATCGTLDVTCKPYFVADTDEKWRCADHRPERVELLREQYREELA